MSKERWNARAKELAFPSMKALLIYHYKFAGHTSGWLSRFLGEGFSRWTVCRMLQEYGIYGRRHGESLTPQQREFWTDELKREGTR